MQERQEVAKQFRSSYYWNSYVIQHGKRVPEKALTNAVTSPKNAT